MKNIIFNFSVTLILLILAACGGGSSGSNQTQTATTNTIGLQAKTTATLKINLTGALPTGTAIAGVAFTLILPQGVTPVNTNAVVANEVVTPSGTFAGGILTPTVYTAATASSQNNGTLKIVLANSAPAGVTQVGEIATITLLLAGANPTIADFTFLQNSISVIDVTGSSIIGINATVASVALQ